MKFSDIIPYSTVIIALILIELLFSYKRQWKNYSLKECLSSLAVKHIELATNVLYAIAFSPVFFWFYKNRIFSFELSNWTQPVLYMAVIEFVYYWSHRFSHVNRIGWANHATHHSFTKLNLINGSRVGVTTPFALYYFVTIPIFAVGFDPGLFFVYLKWHLLYQLVVHTELVGRLGLLDTFLNTPSNHRVHHGTQGIYKNKNFGSITVIFDRIFGTYQRELENEKPVYGLSDGQISQNPIAICLFGWVRLFQTQNHK